ncbi:MAG: hypothetical protein KGN34_01465 [Sphingomonadales bacterium]|nr:hypothetical protein [Sphingomonadales bacterium]
MPMPYVDATGWSGFLLGLAALAAGIGALRKPGIWRTMIEEVNGSPALQFVCGMLELMVGGIVYLANPFSASDVLASAIRIIGGFMMAEALVILAFVDIYTQAWLRNLANMHRGWAMFTVIVGVALVVASGYHFTLHPID